MIDLLKFNLFSLILWCYKELEKHTFKDIIVSNNIWSFEPFTKYDNINYGSFIFMLKKLGYDSNFSNPRFLSFLISYLDKNIHFFDEYILLFKEQQQNCLENDEYILIISPENYITKQINKFALLDKNNSNKGLRKQRVHNPRKTSHLLDLKNLHFIRKDSGFRIKQIFSIYPSLSNELRNGNISISFCPFQSINNDISFFRINVSNSLFSISYRQDKIKEYENYLYEQIPSAGSIVIFPELVNLFSNTVVLGNVLSVNNYDSDKLIVAGSNWNLGKNTCYIFDDRGELLLAQDKYNPFVFEGENGFVFENLLLPTTNFEVNLLHIKSFGLLAFPICSDLLSSKYIESILCESGVTTLIVPCMSESRDIFSSFLSLSSEYLISIFACNGYYGKNRVIGCYSLPKKNKGKRSALVKYVVSKKCRKGKIINSYNIKINLKRYSK